MKIEITPRKSICAGLLIIACLVIGWENSPVTGTEKNVSASKRTLSLPKTPYRYTDIKLPSHFKKLTAQTCDNTPTDNPVTDAGATLGRVLFYDKRLSGNNTVSCGSCHVQEHGFADSNRYSKGFNGKLSDRHAMTTANLRYYPRNKYFWDERATSLEKQVLMPIQSKSEMGQDLKKLNGILAKDDAYQKLFHQAFGDSKVTSDRIARALAQFVRSQVSCQSKYDEGRAQVNSINDNFKNFTDEENHGKSLFMRGCAICHLPANQEAHFFLDRPTNIGLDLDFVKTDGGVGDLTLESTQIGLFKSPSLRNVEVTGPYMHDGRFITLEEVIDHYSKNIKPHPNLDFRLRLLRGLNFSKTEKADLVTFLKTLTDKKFLSDPKFSDPFK